MEQENTVINAQDARVIARKSWTAYIKIAGIAFVLFLTVVPIAWSTGKAVGSVVTLLCLAFLTYKILVINSYQLSFDDRGVWCFYGILPWAKGSSGVKWRDLDEAVFFQSMGSWLFKSYSIRLGHRFTKSSEVILTHMALGHQAVQEINERHQALVELKALN